MASFFKTYDRFDQADLMRRTAPELRHMRGRWRLKAAELRVKAWGCKQEGVRQSFLDLASTYDGMADREEGAQ